MSDEGPDPIETLRELVTCRCTPLWTERGLHDDYCRAESGWAVDLVEDLAEELKRLTLDPKRYAITVCPDCHSRRCPGHIADEALARYGSRINELEDALANEGDDLSVREGDHR